MVQIPQVQQCSLHILITPAFYLHTGDHHDIQSSLKKSFIQPITLSDQPGHPVTYDTVPNFLTHRNPQTILICAIFQDIHD